jgi:hypothetical protein
VLPGLIQLSFDLAETECERGVGYVQSRQVGHLMQALRPHNGPALFE